MVCTAVCREIDGSPGAEDVYRTGTLLRVVKMLKFPDDSYRLLVQGVGRRRTLVEAPDDALAGASGGTLVLVASPDVETAGLRVAAASVPGSALHRPT